MAQLLVRNIEANLAEQLRKQAAANGVSMEEEHRRILRKALSADKDSFKEMLSSIPEVGLDADFERIPQPQRDLEF